MGSAPISLATILYVLIGMAAVGGAVLSVKSLREGRRPSSAKHRASFGRPSPLHALGWRTTPGTAVGYPHGYWLPAAAAEPGLPAPRTGEPKLEPVIVSPSVPYPAWPGEPRAGWVDSPGRTAPPTISLREWYEDPYAGNVTEPHDPWRALYDSVHRLRGHDDLHPSA